MVKTIPPWHNYTGPGRKSQDYSLPGTTTLDWISKEHDKSIKTKTIIGTFSNSIEQSKGNIKADWNFIKSFLWYLINIPTDLIAGLFGIVFLFVPNIILNYINIRRTKK